jgi:hypothetical protein
VGGDDIQQPFVKQRFAPEQTGKIDPSGFAAVNALLTCSSDNSRGDRSVTPSTPA